MHLKHLQLASVLLVSAGMVFIGFVYLTGPKNVAEIVTKGRVATGTYSVDKTEFQRGLDLFRAEDYIGAREAFGRADPEKRDAETQFMIAYSFYRQGWGRLSNDDQLFTQGLAATQKASELDSQFRSSDPSLVLKTPTELRAELEDGLKVTLSDFDPRRLTRERK